MFVQRVMNNFYKTYKFANISVSSNSGYLVKRHFQSSEPQVWPKHSSSEIDEWVAALTPHDKSRLRSALEKSWETGPSSSPTPLTSNELLKVGTHYALPFVGFGFLDNFIMIIAGDYIDLTIGTTLGISTMAAAALGNAVSDVAGIGSAWYVESLSGKLGFPQPKLEPAQLLSRSVRWSINIGRAIGVTVGCILGMLPLLFLPTSEGKEKNAKAAT